MTDAGALTLTLDETRALCERAATAAGARIEVARSLARASVAAEAAGTPALGLAHFTDYLDALVAGRIDGQVLPEVSCPTPILFDSDARGGVPHLGFDQALDGLVEAAREFGLAAFSQRNAYNCGELGHFTRLLAERGLIALAATNGPALLAGSGSSKPVFCTNPVAFAAPQEGAPPLLIDQSSSQTAFVRIREAAAAGHPIPEGLALDAEGDPTTDPVEAMSGALLPFGGARGANIALIVEVLAAGLTAANWSLDAPSFREGAECPRTGLFVLAMAPDRFGDGFQGRLRRQLDRLRRDYGVYIPGQKKGEAAARARTTGVTIPRDLHDRIAAFTGRSATPSPSKG